ncbi:MAG: phosphotransferase family protein [Acidobacteria bacterium]|nr:MAG: phosphotransferase family protein [Acidobacteriota bacterium]
MASSELIDRPREVRPGEELDLERLAAYLGERLPELAGPLELAQFPSGYSNLTYLLRRGSRQLVLRRPPHGSTVKTAHDMGREYRVLKALVKHWGKVPRPLLYCDDPAVVGAPFYLMERVRGVILRARPPAGLVLEPGLMRSLSQNLIDTLVELHALDVEAIGLAELGRPKGYVARQVEGWIGRYERARTDDAPELSDVARWLHASQPPSSPGALIHNDYKYDNVVLDAADLRRIIAVLDWEMATVGDPLMDLGTTLAYWTEAGDPPVMRMFGLTALPGNLDRRQLVERYAASSGREVEPVLFYYVYGLFKCAGIVQQIYARYRQGATRDPRFASLVEVVHAAADMARRALACGRIDHLFD